jgi:hypothetical protein
MWNWIKGIWESKKSVVVAAVCTAIEGYKPQLVGLIRRYVSNDATAQTLAAEIILDVTTYIKRQA